MQTCSELRRAEERPEKKTKSPDPGILPDSLHVLGISTQSNHGQSLNPSVTTSKFNFGGL